MIDKVRLQAIHVAIYLVRSKLSEYDLYWNNHIAEINSLTSAVMELENVFTDEAIAAMSMHYDFQRHEISDKEYKDFLSNCFFTDNEIQALLQYAYEFVYDWRGTHLEIRERRRYKRRDYLY